MSLSLLLGTVNAACSAGARPAPAAVPASSAAGAPVQVWQARAGRRFTGPVVMRAGTIYGAGLDRKVYAVDVESGRTQWSSRLGALIAGGVLVSGDTVFAASSRPEGRVYALDAESGHRFWRTRVGSVSAPLALAHGVLLAENQAGEVVGLDPTDGDVRWRRKLGVARVAAVPADSGTFVVATVDSLFRVSSTDGRVVQRAVSPGTVLSPWVRHEGLLVGGTTDSMVVGVGIDDLRLHWKAALDAPVLDSPALAGGAVFAASRRGTVYRITLDSTANARKLAELEWPVTAPVTWYDGLILLGGADGVLRALRPDGEEAWRLQLRWPIELAPLPLPDGLLAIGGGGDLHRYRQ